LNILLVEDNQADADLFLLLLNEKQSSSKTYWVTRGDEALNYVFQNGHYEKAIKPDIIVLDLGLPRVDGYDVLRRLKEDPVSNPIPILVLSTSSNPRDKAQCLALGAAGYASKPFNLEEYERLIDQLVERDFPRMLKAG